MEPAANHPTKRTGGPPLRPLIWWTIWLCIASWMLVRIPTEVSYWQLALAEQASQQGRNEQALQWIEQAKQWTPESALPYERQAQILLKEKKANPLAAIDKMLASNPPNAMKARLHLVKSEILKVR